MKYEIFDGVLMKRVYILQDNEVQMRIVAPTTAINAFDVPGVGHVPLGVREKILLEYHNGRMGGHVGADKTARRILKDWYWSGVYDDVDKWCKGCDICQGEHGPTGISAWTRTELYSRPFR